MKKYFLLLLSCLLFCCSLHAQQDESQVEIDSLQKIVKSTTDEKKKANALHELGKVYHRKSDFKNALIYYSEALTLWKKIKDNRGIANTSNNMGLIYEEKGNYPKALESHLASWHAEEELNDRIGVATSRNNIGLVYHELGEYENALNNYFAAQKSFEEFYNKSRVQLDSEGISDINDGIASSKNNIGRIHNILRKYDSAIQYHKDALHLFSKIPKISGMAEAFNNLGAAYLAMMNYSLAEAYCDSAIQVQKRNVASKVSVDVFINLALINEKVNKNEKAITFFHNALAISDSIEYPLGKANTFLSMGQSFLNRSLLTEAENYLHKGLGISSNIGAKDVMKSCYEELAALYRAKKEYSRFFEYNELFLAMKDSLDDESKANIIDAHKIQQDSDKQIENLEYERKRERDNRNLSIISGMTLVIIAVGFGYYRNKRLKAKAFKEITEAKLASLKSLMDKHFISGSLNSIDGFLTNHDSESASDYLTKYSKLIRNILHFSDKPEVTLEEEVELCKSFLYLEKIHYDNSFDYSVEINNNISLPETLFPSLLLQPVIENAVKHGVGSLMADNKTTKGFIKVTIMREDDRLVCRVIDNGKGLGFSSNSSGDHQSYSGKGIAERIRVYNSIRKNKASFTLADNKPGVTAELIVPYMGIKRSQRMTA